MVEEPWNPYREVTQPEVHQNPRILIRASNVRQRSNGQAYHGVWINSKIRKEHLEFQRNFSIGRREIFNCFTFLSHCIKILLQSKDITLLKKGKEERR